jgi:hypothetical protein
MRLSIDLPSGQPLTTEVDDAHAARAHELLARLVEPAAMLADRDTSESELDWATVRLRAHAGAVVAEEPDYSRDPSRFVPSLSVTCRVFDAQQMVLGAVGVDSQPVAAHQYVRVSLAAMSSISVVGYRQRDLEEPFTGWQLVSTASAADDEVSGQYTVRELAEQHLAWIVAMVLPDGWSFRCVGSTVADCVSPEGRTYELLASLDV